MYNVVSNTRKEKSEWIKHVLLQLGHFVGTRTALSMPKSDITVVSLLAVVGRIEEKLAEERGRCFTSVGTRKRK